MSQPSHVPSANSRPGPPGRRLASALRDLASRQASVDETPQAGDLGITSAASYQLFLHRDDDDRFGALNLYGSRPDAFDERAIEIGEVFAAHCATTLAAAISQEGVEAALQTRDLIGQAKGILMERHRLTADQAFERLSAASQARNVKLRQIAEIVTSTGYLPNEPRPARVQPPPAPAVPAHPASPGAHRCAPTSRRAHAPAGCVPARAG